MKRFALFLAAAALGPAQTAHAETITTGTRLRSVASASASMALMRRKAGRPAETATAALIDAASRLLSSSIDFSPRPALKRRCHSADKSSGGDGVYRPVRSKPGEIPEEAIFRETGKETGSVAQRTRLSARVDRQQPAAPPKDISGGRGDDGDQ